MKDFPGKTNLLGKCTVITGYSGLLCTEEIKLSQNPSMSYDITMPVLDPSSILILNMRGFVGGKSLYDKLCDHLGKREKLDLRSTNYIYLLKTFATIPTAPK